MDTRRPVVALLASLLASAMATATLDTVLGIQVFAISGRPLDLGLLGLAAFAPSALLVLVTGLRRRPLRSAVGRRVGPSRASRRRRRAVRLPREQADDGRADLRVRVLLRRGARVRGPARARVAGRHRRTRTGAVGRRPFIGDVADRARSSDRCSEASCTPPNTQLPYVAVFVLMLASAVLVLVVPAARTGAPGTGDAGDRGGRSGRDAERAGDNRSDAVEGFRFVRSQPIVLGAISLDLFAVLFGGAVALLPALADERLTSARSASAGCGPRPASAPASVTLRLAVRPVHRHVGRWLLGAVATFGVATIVLGVTRTYAIAFVAMLVLAGADSISVFVRATLVPLVTPASSAAACSRSRASSSARRTSSARSSPASPVRSSAAGAVVLGGAATLAVALARGRARSRHSVPSTASPPRWNRRSSDGARQRAREDAVERVGHAAEVERVDDHLRVEGLAPAARYP